MRGELPDSYRDWDEQWEFPSVPSWLEHADFVRRDVHSRVDAAR